MENPRTPGKNRAWNWSFAWSRRKVGLGIKLLPIKAIVRNPKLCEDFRNSENGQTLDWTLQKISPSLSLDPLQLYNPNWRRVNQSWNTFQKVFSNKFRSSSQILKIKVLKRLLRQCDGKKRKKKVERALLSSSSQLYFFFSSGLRITFQSETRAQNWERERQEQKAETRNLFPVSLKGSSECSDWKKKQKANRSYWLFCVCSSEATEQKQFWASASVWCVRCIHKSSVFADSIALQGDLDKGTKVCKTALRRGI